MLRFLPLFLLVPMLAFGADNLSPDSKKALRHKNAAVAIEPPVVPAAENGYSEKATRRLVRSGKSEAEVLPIESIDPNSRGLMEFSGDPMDLVLRTLARKAKMNLVLSETVSGGAPRKAPTLRFDEAPSGAFDVLLQLNSLLNFVTAPVSTESPLTVNLRLEDKTAREAIEVICQANGLVMTDKNGVYYIKTKFDDAVEAARDLAHRRKLAFDAYLAEGFTRAEAMQFILQQGPTPTASGVHSQDRKSD